MASTSGPSDNQKGVQSVEVAARLLDALVRAGGGAALKRISADAGLSPSRAHSYLVSLKRAGLVEQDTGSGEYILGPQARQIGLAAIDHRDQYDVLLAATRRARDETGRTVYLAIWSERGPTVAHWSRGREPLTLLVMNSGLNPPLLTTAMGRIFLTFLPTEHTEAIVRDELAALKGGEVFPGLLEKGAIDRLKAKVHEDGFSYIKGSLSPFVSAIAAPIMDESGNLFAVLNVMGMRLHPDLAGTQTVISQIKSIARQTEKELGRT
ncbi:IclR family transcriptional regulator [Hyphomonas johnsonii]|jgi:DNA-binding IclR family transcriptional regulator|uniref:IclR family transcriptional regulator n=1 Tax=Hyphomonas johnsonii MHS-2 TaxID=1280950 RepID=A0A059FSI4_9PROT|nr:IclR family transcriptional regulator [Hyphomonas johnsonii]KCZ93471.1 IclR family transcriptional regulator [Hyphomonas johnsonii MHS-2]